MTALTADRNTPRRSGDLIVLPVRKRVATTIYAGSLVTAFDEEDLTRSAVPGGTTQSITPFFFMGVAEETVHNPQGGTATVRVRRRGVFQFAYEGTLYAGKIAAIIDDQTVGPVTNAAGKPIVGLVVEVDGSSAWVELNPALSALVDQYPTMLGV